MAFLFTALVSVAVHLALGWEWTVFAGVAGGLAARRSSGWIVGAGGVALGWAALVIYTAAVAPAALRILTDTLERLAGNIPGEVLVGLTVLLGSLLGGIGGGIGTLIRPWVHERLFFAE